MFWLAFKTLIREKGRLIITLTGIIFSTVLTLAQVSMYLGMMGNATGVIRHMDADIWVMSKNVQDFDFSNPFPEDRINRVRAFDDVVWADRLILTWGFLKLANGGQEQVQVIGYNPDTGVGAPWSMVVGNPEEVRGGRYMIIDKTAAKRLGKLEVGSLWELSEMRFKLVGISDGIKSFTTTPVIFMAYNQIHNYLPGLVKPKQTSYIVAKLRDRSKTRQIVNMLKDSMKDNDVYSRDEFIMKTVMYWTVQTGMGMGFF